MKRAQRIVDQILSSERYTSSHTFGDRLFQDEPILRTGADAFRRGGGDKSVSSTARDERDKSPASAARAARASHGKRVADDYRADRDYRAAYDDGTSSTTRAAVSRSAYGNAHIRPITREPEWTQSSRKPHMPARYRSMRALAREGANRSWNSYYASPYSQPSSRVFFEQAKHMEGYEDHFEGEIEFGEHIRCYEDMSNYQLRCYFTWRTCLEAWLAKKGLGVRDAAAHGPAAHDAASAARSADKPDASDIPAVPLSFVLVHACEILCGIGVEPSEAGLMRLVALDVLYGGNNVVFDERLHRWMHDYVVFYGLDPSLIVPAPKSSAYARVEVLRRAETALTGKVDDAWAAFSFATEPAPKAKPARAPTQEELLDALCALSRYRADRSKFVREHREDVAAVAWDVFARMVAHCNKRRKTGFVAGLFGGPMRASYAMFPGAVFWAPHPHADATYVVDELEQYACERGFWWRTYPSKYVDTSKEIGALMHAIDTRMRVATGYGHPLKARSLPKYQSRFVDDAIREHLERKEAEEAARIRIDRSALKGIRSASARTREALLTDEEREDAAAPVVALPAMGAPSAAPASAASAPAAPASAAVPAAPAPTAAAAAPALPLTQDQLAFLRALLDGKDPSAEAGGFVTLAVDAINDAFMDLVGDTVVEFADGSPALVEDYAEDVRAYLEEG